MWLHFLLGNRGAHAYNGNIYTCGQCNRTYKTRPGLQNHKCLFCKKCEKIFSSAQRFNSHVCKVQNPLKCDKCLRTYSSKSTLDRHQCSYCEICKKTFSTPQTYRRHRDSKHHSESFKAPSKSHQSQTCQDSYSKNKNSLKEDKIVHNKQSESLHKEDERVEQQSRSSYKKDNKLDQPAENSKKDNKGQYQEECTVVSETHANFQFKPVDIQWQLNRCMQLKLSVTHPINFPSSSILGQPTKIKRIIGDGNCFFRAVAFALTGCQENHVQYRQLLTSYMVINSEVLSTLLQNRIQGVGIKDYITRSGMCRNSVWASEVEIFASAHYLKTDIYVYSLVGQRKQWLKHSAQLVEPQCAVSNRSIYLQHTHGNHYDVVMSVEGPSDELLQSAEKPFSQCDIQRGHKRMLERDICDLTRKKMSTADLRKEKDKLRKREKRQSEEYRQQERENKKRTMDRESEKIHKQKKRESEEYRSEEKEKKLKTMNRESEKIQKQGKRESEEYRSEEKEKKLKTMNREAEKLHKQEKRESEVYKQHEQENRAKTIDKEGDKLRKHDKRKSEEYRMREKENKMKTIDREAEKIHKQEKRESEEYKQHEKENKLKTINREAEKLHKQEKRESEVYKYYEKENREKTLDREGDKLRKQDKRKSEEYKMQEKENKMKTVNKEAEKLHKQKKRELDEYRNMENARRREDSTFENMIKKFSKSVSAGPEYVCTSCDQLWYRHSVKLAKSVLSKNEELLRRCKTGVRSAQNEEWICETCCRYVKGNKLPPLSKANKTVFPEKPSVLQLTNLEERLVAPRIPFMQLRELPRGGQISIHGNVVNIPTNVNTTVSVLPRKQDDTATIALKLKRKLEYKHHYDYETVRPNKIIDAVNWLVANSDLYKQEGININKTWTWSESEEIQEQGNDEGDDSRKEVDDSKKEVDDSKKEVDNWDETEDSDDQPKGSLDTMMQNVIEETRDILSMAPGEGGKPLSIFMDKHSEELSFPTLFCGQARPDKERDVPILYSELCKSELRRKDRRVASHIPDLFFKAKKLQLKHILDKANICLRKTKGRSTALTAGEVKSQECIDKLVRHDEGYRVFKDLRGSPPYWEKVKKDIFALIRQLGIPTWFSSFSSAETKWHHLLQILEKTVEGKTCSEKDVEKFTWQHKQHLIQSDPVTCARHFDYQVQEFIHKVLFSQLNPIGDITDFFYKVEFQMRGSPHIHMLLWTSESPKMDSSKPEDITDYIDRYVTCSKSDCPDELVQRQIHKHSRTCKKKQKTECRFGFPLPPLKTTQILEPLPSTTEDKDKKKYEALWKKIHTTLNKMKLGEKLSYEAFLQTLEASDDDYISAIRSTLQSKKVFLKRQVDEIRVNSYNKVLLNCWKANMDLQFVLDPYACAMYIVSYIAKAQRGMSNLLHNACQDAKKGNMDLRRQVQSIGHTFLTHVEISAQEAVYLVLQIPLYKSTRDVIFINTSSPDTRATMLKSDTIIQLLPNDSTDVIVEGNIEHYAKRPEEMENVCLADFVSMYRRVKKNSTEVITPENEDDKNEGKDTVVDDGGCYQLGKGYVLKKKRKQSVIRSVNYHYDKDKENHCREILMLYKPWRDESKIIGKCETFQERYDEVIATDPDIELRMLNYSHSAHEVEQAVEDLQSKEDVDLEDAWDKLVPNTQCQERKDEEVGSKVSDIYPSYLPTNDEVLGHSDVAHELGYGGEQDSTDIILNMMKDEEYTELLRSLNRKQREFFYHVMRCIKTEDAPFHLFLTGGAGVGKTAVVTAIYQMAIRFYNKGVGVNPDELKVLLGAPTGKAAYLIHGYTLHTLFNIPASQGFSYKPLTCDRKNTLQSKFRNVKLLIIDEISMVGNQMFSFINQRLQQIMDSTLPFGGISVIAVGDLFQLKPVFDGWIFDNLSHDYGPLAVNLWQEYFKVFILTEVMRQKEDSDYAKLLNRLREGNQTTEDVNRLKTRVINCEIHHPDYPMFIPHIYLKNELVNNYNKELYENAPACKKISITAWDTVIGDVSKEIKDKIISAIPADCSKTMGLLKKLQTAISSRIELSTNVNVEDGLANGSSGTVMHVQVNTNTKKAQYIWVKFDREDMGKLTREQNKHLYKRPIQLSWTPIPQIKRQFKVGRYKSAEVLRCQFPIRPAAAKTAHRCQGDTMESAVISFQGRSFPHAHYVALSRVKSLDRLHLTTLNEKAISVCKSVVSEMTRLTTDCALQTALLAPKTGHFSFIFLNVRSLPKHIEDIRREELYANMDMLMFVESKMSTRDDLIKLELPGYNLYPFPFKSQKSRSSYGTVVYSKDQLFPQQFHNVQPEDGLEFTIIELENVADLPKLTIVVLYASPKASPVSVKNMMTQVLKDVKKNPDVHCIICGDFNINWLEDEKRQILALLGPSYQQRVAQPTTDYGSLLDHVYTNIPADKFSCAVYESYFSDHKPVWSVLQ